MGTAPRQKLLTRITVAAPWTSPAAVSHTLEDRHAASYHYHARAPPYTRVHRRRLPTDTKVTADLHTHACTNRRQQTGKET